VARTEGKKNLEDMSLDGRIILKWVFKNFDWDVDYIDLPKNRDRWRELVNAVMNYQVP
jgi:hypothetical protein